MYAIKKNVFFLNFLYYKHKIISNEHFLPSNKKPKYINPAFSKVA